MLSKEPSRPKAMPSGHSALVRFGLVETQPWRFIYEYVHAHGALRMRIKRIVVGNHQLIPDLDFEVRDHLVLVGPNACGKTSLLRAVDLLLAGNFGQLVNGFPASSVRDESKPLRVEVHFDSFTDSDRASACDEINIMLEGEDQLETLELVLTVSCQENDDPVVTRVFRKPGEDRRVTKEHLAAIDWSFLPASRSPERELGVGRNSAVRSLVSSIELGEAEDDLKGLLAQANAIVDGGADAVRLRKQVAAGLSGVLPREVSEDDLALQVADAESSDPGATTQLLLKNSDGEAAPLHHQSDGLRALSSIVVQRLATPAAITAVDEPEIHLHPRSQARLAHLLAMGEGQRIVATHAAPVLAAFDPTDVVSLTDGVARQISSARVAGDPKFFAQWWSDAAIEPLTSRIVVLVEGPSDRVLLTSVARLLGYDLDQHDCSIVVVHGAPSFKTALRLYGPEGFGLRTAGLVDEEETPIVAKALNCEDNEESLGHGLFVVSGPDLEGESVNGLGVERHASLLCQSGMFSEQEILGAHESASISDIGPTEYANWCRKRKVLHAAALAGTMEAADAEKVASLVRLVTLIKDQ